MKTIGLLGGMSWESTALYYKQINEEVKKQLGGLHSAKVVFYSVDFHEIKKASQGQFSISQRDKNNPQIKKIRVVSTVEYYLTD